MKRTGFTLIELLSAIVIIAIIAMIGVYSITKIMTRSRLKSLNNTAAAAKRVALLHVSQVEIGANEEVVLDLTPTTGEHQSLLDLEKDPWGDDFLSVIAKINRVEERVPTYTVYFTTDHGCFILESDATDLVPGECYTKYFKNYMGVATTNSSLNQYTWIKSIVRDSTGVIHAVYNDNAVTPLKAYYVYSSDNGQTWSNPYAFGTSEALFGLSPSINIDGNDRIHVMFGGGVSDRGGQFHFYKDRGGAWSTERKVGFIHSGDEVYYMAQPAIDQNNQLHLTYSGHHWSGTRYRYWNGTSWTAKTNIDASQRDLYFQNTLVIGSNLYYFYRGGTYDSYLWFKMRTNNVWSTNVKLTTYANSNYHNEIVDHDGNIWVFMMDPTGTSKIVAQKYTVSTNTWGGWSVVDSDSTRAMGYPTATVTSSGDIYLFYNYYDTASASWQILYKVFDHQSKTWSERNEFTTIDKDGSCAFPKIKYQNYFSNSQDTIELTYRQNNVGSTTYKLYYGRLAAPN